VILTRQPLQLMEIDGSAVSAQSMTGTWQGTLTVPNSRDLRIVIKIGTNDADHLKGVFHSIDQPGQGLPTGAIRGTGFHRQDTGPRDRGSL
jgi:hypothetical protein